MVLLFSFTRRGWHFKASVELTGVPENGIRFFDGNTMFALANNKLAVVYISLIRFPGQEHNIIDVAFRAGVLTNSGIIGSCPTVHDDDDDSHTRVGNKQLVGMRHRLRFSYFIRFARYSTFPSL